MVMHDFSNILIWLAAFLSLLGLLAHEFLGAPMVLPPLSRVDLPKNIVWLHHFSWHVGSIAVAAMIALYAYAALVQGNLAMAVIATAMSLGFSILGIGLAVGGNHVLWKTPAPYVWSIVTVVGGLALLKAA